MSDNQKWQRLIQANGEYIAAADSLLRDSEDLAAIFRGGLRGTVLEILTSLGLLSQFDNNRLFAIGSEVFEDIVRLCMSTKFGTAARSIVLKMPRQWVVDNLNRVLDPLLEGEDHLGFGMILALLAQLDKNMAVEVAKRASQSDDLDIKEVGEHFLVTIDGGHAR